MLTPQPCVKLSGLFPRLFDPLEIRTDLAVLMIAI